MRLSLFAAVAGVAAAAVIAVAPARSVDAGSALEATPDGRQLALTFFDDFDTFRPYDERAKSGIWRTTYGPVRGTELNQRTLTNNREEQYYVDTSMEHADPGPFPVNPFRSGGGLLEIVADKTPPALIGRLQGYKYTSGLITTQTSFQQQYGYFEMRAKLPEGKGLWPAFWMLPADLSWPPEIDVMESIGDPTKVFMTIHSKMAEQRSDEAKVSNGFHVYAVSWDAKDIIWYIDGVEAARRKTPGDMHRPMYLLANLAVGGHWPGSPDETTRLPGVMTIDYIRAYRFGS